MVHEELIPHLSRLGDVGAFGGRDGARLLRAELALHSLYIHAVSRYLGHNFIEWRIPPSGARFEATPLLVFLPNGQVNKEMLIHGEAFSASSLERPRGSILTQLEGIDSRYRAGALQRMDELFERSDGTIMFSPVPHEVYERYGLYEVLDKLAEWTLLYLDLDHLDISVEDLLCFDFPQAGSCWYIKPDSVYPRIAPRALSRAWRKIYEEYRDDPEVLSLIYHDSLWYHTGRHLHVVLFGRWSDRKVDIINRWRSRLRSDPRQTVHPKMKVRLAGSVNPKNGSVALGYYHPFAVPYYTAYTSRDNEVARFFSVFYSQLGMMSADEDVWRPRAPAPVSPADLVDNGYPEYHLSHGLFGSKTFDIHMSDLRRRCVSVPISLRRDDIADIWDRVCRRGEPAPDFAEFEYQDGDTCIRDVWHWKIEFDAEPVGRCFLDRLGASGLSVNETADGRLTVSGLYSHDRPSWMKCEKKVHSSRDFKAFRVHVTRVSMTERRAASLVGVTFDAKVILDALDARVLLELEWGVACALRSSNRLADLLAFVWLNHLKRTSYTDGVVPRHEALEYLMSNVGWSVNNTNHRIRRLLKLGWISECRRGYVVHGWSYVAGLVNVGCEKLFMISGSELKSTKGLKSVLASIPGTFKQPLIKYEISKRLGVHVSTVKRNRKGRCREWFRVRFVMEYESPQEADEARLNTPHPVHGWPLVLCGYRMAPAKAGKKKWRLLRSSAAAVLDLVVVQRCGKSKRLRRQTAHLAKVGSGVGSGVETFVPHDQTRYTNFTISHQFDQCLAGDEQCTMSLEELVRRMSGLSSCFD